MTATEQLRDLQEGLRLLESVFPDKIVRYFIAPFNRANDDTRAICRELGIGLLAADGVHLEESLPDLRVTGGTWYRYHHHRFYPESSFTYYPLSFEALEASLGRNFEPVPNGEGRVTGAPRAAEPNVHAGSD